MTSVSGAMRVSRAKRRVLETADVVEVELENASASPVGAGGLLMWIHLSGDVPSRMSVSNHWPLVSGETVLLSVILPKEMVKAVEFVAYAEWDGTVHGLGIQLTFGFFSTKLEDAPTDDLR